MLKVKDTLRATVNLGFDGKVYKTYHGRDAKKRFETETRVLRHLEKRGCDFVPRLIEADARRLRIVTTNCGARVEHLDEGRRRELFGELAKFGVRHDDPDMRNVTYRRSDGRFCIIDFEFATVMPAARKAEALAAKSDERPPITRLRWHGYTDRGRIRPNNEDAFVGIKFDGTDSQGLGKTGEASIEGVNLAFAVSDGMGGALAGEYASKITVDKITTVLPHAFQNPARDADFAASRALTLLFREVDRALKYLGASYAECSDMEATLSLCWFTPGRLYFGHVGDSRIYYSPGRGGGLRQLTEDDTHVGWLLRQGRINEREARSHPRRNVLQKALGGGNQFVDPQFGSVKCEPGDLFLICSDGLAEGLHDQALLEILRPESPIADRNPAQELAAESIARDGRDNVTALVIEAR